MKYSLFAVAVVITFFVSCSSPEINNGKEQPVNESNSDLVGTWKLLTGTTIKGKDTVVTDYTVGQEMIKIISPTHFAFLRHDLTKGKDSLVSYAAGGGRIKFNDSTYTEYLDYFSIREWEGGEFILSYKINGDTLTTTGVERVEELGIDHLNVERLVRVK
ncbi:hypothetical protein [Flavihumibacter sp. UBA7668]|uniref:hypothetical protein n=1 Tax=Flavihumibacter sp. UBA7668 TaxID=1946542 RepID=UPI0025C2C8EC|nr:hypothetical protein [Flavihumibacter sp. UBA7668]